MAPFLCVLAFNGFVSFVTLLLCTEIEPNDISDIRGAHGTSGTLPLPLLTLRALGMATWNVAGRDGPVVTHRTQTIRRETRSYRSIGVRLVLDTLEQFQHGVQFAPEACEVLGAVCNFLRCTDGRRVQDFFDRVLKALEVRVHCVGIFIFGPRWHLGVTEYRHQLGIRFCECRPLLVRVIDKALGRGQFLLQRSAPALGIFEAFQQHVRSIGVDIHIFSRNTFLWRMGLFGGLFVAVREPVERLVETGHVCTVK